MGTRSRIAMQNEDGSITSIYCHWDGYPSHNGKILKENYTNPQKVKSLMELGSLSSLAPEIGEPQDFDNRDTQRENWCLAYGRDRGEKGTEARTHPNLKSLGEFLKEADQEYLYLFEKGEWKYCPIYWARGLGKWETL